MARVSFTSALKRFFPDISSADIPAQTVAELLEQLENQHPGLKDYLVDEHGVLRKHVNIYIGESLIHDRQTLQDQVNNKDEVLFFQALSGG